MRFCEGLKRLGAYCFERTGVRKLILPASVKFVDSTAFSECECLESADLSAARSLKALLVYTFRRCGELRCVSLNEGL